MNTQESFSNSICTDQVRKAERELSAFIGAVTRSYGPEQGLVAAEDWLDEAEMMDSPPRSACRDWRAVTVAASARLAKRLNAAPPRRTSVGTSLGALVNTKVSPIPSSNCPVHTLLV
jgi:hypothetical protein